MKPGDPNKKQVFDNMVKNFSHLSFITDKKLQLYPQSDSDSDGESKENETAEDAKRRREKRKAKRKGMQIN